MPGGAPIGWKLKIGVTTVVAVTVLDQAAKALVLSSLGLNESVSVIPGLLNLVYYMNPGAAFGIFNDGGMLRTLFLIGISVIALVVVGVLLARAKDRFTALSLSLIAGGAAGNLIDRVRFGEVVDFIDFYIGSYHWPAFNVADTAISVGVFLAFYSFWFMAGHEDDEAGAR